jgi:hypothetical protein
MATWHASRIVGSTVAMACVVALAASGAPNIERVSVAVDGTIPDRPCASPSISGDGGLVAFASTATNLVALRANGKSQIFIRDRRSNRTELISLSVRGTPGNDDSAHPSISVDGRFVAFDSLATDLVAGGTRGQQIFVRDRLTGRTELVSISSRGAPADKECCCPAISAPDARLAFWVAFESDATNLIDRAQDANGSSDVFVHLRDPANHSNNITLLASTLGPDSRQGIGNSHHASISEDGRYVKFEVSAGRDPEHPTMGTAIRVRDQREHMAELRNVTVPQHEPADGDSGASVISGDGLNVAFSSEADNLDTLFTDPNHASDVFVNWHLEDGTLATEQVSLTADGTQPDGKSGPCGISFDGRYVVFRSSARELVPRDEGPGIFIRDRTPSHPQTVRVGVPLTGETADAFSAPPVISADGHFVAFSSNAADLVPGDLSHPITLIYAAPNPLYRGCTCVP